MNDLGYKVRDGYPKVNCAEEWTKHRQRTRIVWLLFAGWIPYGFLINIVLTWLHVPINFAFVAVIPYLVAFVISSNVVSMFRCPRCGSRFYAWGPWGLGHNAFARSCRNCGLRKWQCDGINRTPSVSSEDLYLPKLNCLQPMLKATAAEFRLRFLICIAIYVLGFTAPWNHLLHLDAGRTAWLSLAAWPAHNQWLTFTATTVTLLAISILCALAAALLRTWASACLGPTVVQAHTMQGDTVVASGPFRYLRNPLYLGTFIHTFALALLMPPTGAIFCILAIGLFQLRLIAAEEAFLTAKLGDPYLAYCARVPRLFPAFTPHVPASPTPAKWPAAFLAEIYMWGVVASFAILGWRYNAFLIIQGIIVSLGLSLIARAFIPKR